MLFTLLAVAPLSVSTSSLDFFILLKPRRLSSPQPNGSDMFVWFRFPDANPRALQFLQKALARPSLRGMETRAPSQFVIAQSRGAGENTGGGG